MCVHGVGHDPPLVRALVPAAGIFQACVRAGRTDGRGFERLPGLLGDFLSAGCSHGLEDMHQQGILEALHVDEVQDILHVAEEFAALLVFVASAGR